LEEKGSAESVKRDPQLIDVNDEILRNTPEEDIHSAELLNENS
jgi:hypothetical protein